MIKVKIEEEKALLFTPYNAKRLRRDWQKLTGSLPKWQKVMNSVCAYWLKK